VTEYRLIAKEYRQATKRDENGKVLVKARHRRGDVFSIVDDLEAARLIRAGAIVPANEDDDEDDEQARINAELDAAARAAQAEADAKDAQLNAAPADTGAPAAERVKRPGRNATRELWLEYALDQPDVDVELVNAATKADLIEQFGE